jgi:hypothetical protein
MVLVARVRHHPEADNSPRCGMPANQIHHKLPNTEREASEWQAAMEAPILAASRGGQRNDVQAVQANARPEVGDVADTTTMNAVKADKVR